MPTSLTPSERVLRARLAAHVGHSRHDSKELTAPLATSSISGSSMRLTQDRVLTESERNRRADHARKAYFTRLALLSAKARRSGRSS